MIHLCEQRSPAWHALRLGKITASRVADALSIIKKGESAARRNYRIELLAEIFTGQRQDHFVTKEMQWGADQEPFAIAAYEIQQDLEITAAGFFTHDHIPDFGGSPDGLVGGEGMVEAKCPTTATHVAWLLAGVVPAEYEPQMLALMACTGRQWVDFISFDPRMPHGLRLFVVRFHRDEARIAQLEAGVTAFNEELEAARVQLALRAPLPQVAFEPVDVTATLPDALAALVLQAPLPTQAEAVRQRRILREMQTCIDAYFAATATEDDGFQPNLPASPHPSQWGFHLQNQNPAALLPFPQIECALTILRELLTEPRG
jgi:putative phage-type endonuclease